MTGTRVSRDTSEKCITTVESVAQREGRLEFINETEV